MRNNNRTNLQDKTSSSAVDSKVIKSSNRKPEASNSNNISSKTIPQNNSNEPKDSRINSDSNRSNTPVGSASNGNNTTTGLHNNAAPLKYINNRLLGRGIVPGTGSLITEHGNNAAAIAVTVFLMTVSVPPMARITDSAFIVFR